MLGRAARLLAQIALDLGDLLQELLHLGHRCILGEVSQQRVNRLTGRLVLWHALQWTDRKKQGGVALLCCHG